MSEPVEVGGFSYRIGRIDARKQFHVSRRLMPILASLGGAAALSSGAGMGFAKLLGPMSEVLSKMSDEDVDYVLDACLGVCQRLQPNGQGAPVMARGGGMMFNDIDMGQMVQLTVHVIRENLSVFFPAATAESPPAA